MHLNMRLNGSVRLVYRLVSFDVDVLFRFQVFRFAVPCFALSLLIGERHGGS